MDTNSVILGAIVAIVVVVVAVLAYRRRQKDNFNYWADAWRLAGTSRENMSTAKFIRLSRGEGFISAAYPCGERFTPDAPGACDGGRRRAAEIELSGLLAMQR
ncbi:MAG: hypothetical protein WC700_07730 [Gemmatimonadaceae bacterium]|jgi:hypothetical protein